MKKFALVIVLVFCAAVFTQSFAQAGAMRVGPVLAYGLDMKTLGIGGKFHYGITEKIRAAPSAVYFLEKNGFKYWELNLDANYLFTDPSSMGIYALAGLNVLGSSFEFMGVSGSATDIGFNAGGGFQLPVGNSMFGFAEAKYRIGDASEIQISAGILFKL
ncbi:MAG: hypothetical protein Q7J34_07750 [Bacteroidales bacterium]|nr:hypothetical protein [Bacteroidales bacterium]